MDRSKNRFITAGLVLLSGAAFVAPAQAEGLYVGAGLYKTSADFGPLDDDDTTPAVFLGQTMIDTNVVMVGAELGYYDLGHIKAQNIEIESDAIGLAASVTLPVGPMFEVYGKAGIASVSVDVKSNGSKSDEDGTELFGGIGIAFDILDTIDIYAEYLQFDTEVNSDMLGIGARLAF